MRDLVSVGVITGAHGVRGEVKLRSFTAEPAAIASYSPLATKAGALVEIVRLRPRTDGFIAVLKGVIERNGAEALKGTELFVDRALLPEPEPDEVYLDDLIGLGVWTKAGAKLGEVIAVRNFGAGDLIDVKMTDRRDTVLIPFAKPFVLATDVAGGKITVDLPDGFLDEGE